MPLGGVITGFREIQSTLLSPSTKPCSWGLQAPNTSPSRGSFLNPIDHLIGSYCSLLINGLHLKFCMLQSIEIILQPIEIIPANSSAPTPSLLLEDVFFAPLLQALKTPGITRGCAAVDDPSVVALAVLRVLENSKTGRYNKGTGLLSESSLDMVLRPR